MKKGMKTILISILCVQVTLFLYYSFLGEYGFIYLREVHKETESITMDIVQLQKELEDLKREIDFCKTSLFYEQYARTRLHMAHEDEDIYLT